MRHIRRYQALLSLVFALAVGSCSVIMDPGNDGGGDGGTNKPDEQTPAPEGYAAIVFLNHSKTLVQNVVSVEYKGLKPQVWATPVTPESWDSLVVDCPFQRIRVLATTPVDLETGAEGEQVLFDGNLFTDGDNVTCGSIVVVETRDADTPAGSVTLTARTLPSAIPAKSNVSALAPGASSGLVLIRPEVPDGLTADVRATWESEDGRVYAASWRVSGVGRAVAALVECPLTRVGWGNLRDPETPGATIVDGEIDLPAPEPLRSILVGGAADELQCGDSVILRLVSDSTTDAGYRLDIVADSEGSAVPTGVQDLFGQIRELISTEGFAGRLSNNGLLLPEPVQPPAE